MKHSVFIAAAHQYQSPEKISGFTVGNNKILAITKDKPEIIALNNDLTFLWKRNFLLHWGKYVPPRITISPDDLLIGIAEINAIRLATIDGTVLFRQEHEAWDAFLGGDLFFTENHVLFVTPGPEKDRLTMMELSNFKIISTIELPGRQENNYTFHRTPHPEMILLEAAAGQDDCTLFLIKQSTGNITIEELKVCNDRIMGGFSPDGGLFVTAPHYDEGIEWFSFPLVNRAGEISQSEIFNNVDPLPAEEPDSLNYQTLFIADKIIAVLTRFGRILLINIDTGKIVTELTLQELEPKGYDEGGQETRDPEKIYDYASDLTELKFVAPNRLLARHSSGKLLSYSLSL
ncbi:hypothetical protein [Niabella drilacis]|uniref:TolB-like 6-blade propeller-like n=1 Tax=Niabella drilacis (strain DSM 25811 / CCM 8410 / CCUG 62505 / LMG 26954 / E90) TaxID=1285928 RepID=A0A1G6XJ97_NIADE|nr:hypothetical protein [Niabella drilacis]SDD77276.1 hypothetical protein SAMN04487894_11368 [Niabella drilacis]